MSYFLIFLPKTTASFPICLQTNFDHLLHIIVSYLIKQKNNCTKYYQKWLFHLCVHMNVYTCMLVPKYEPGRFYFSFIAQVFIWFLLREFPMKLLHLILWVLSSNLFFFKFILTDFFFYFSILTGLDELDSYQQKISDFQPRKSQDYLIPGKWMLRRITIFKELVFNLEKKLIQNKWKN